MGSENSSSQVAIANSIADEASTEDLVPVAGEVGDLAPVLPPLGIAEANSSLNLILDLIIDVLNAAVDDGGTLAERSQLEILFRFQERRLYL